MFCFCRTLIFLSWCTGVHEVAVSRTGSCNQFNANGACWYLVMFIWYSMSIWYCLLWFLMCDLFMEFAFVLLQALSWWKGFVTVTTWNRYSFQMIRLNVISYVLCKAFLATHFANGWYCLYWRPICKFTIWNHLLTFLHHGLHLFIQGF